MLAPPLPDAAESRDNASFAALLEALSRPGTVHDIPEPGLRPLVLTLIDRECLVTADMSELRELIRASGATLVADELADHAILDLSTEAGALRLARVPTGDLLYPETGATVLAEARIGSGQRLRLTGPGVDGTAEVAIGGLHPGVWTTRDRVCQYPFGIELVLVDGLRIVALPRSVNVEVL